MVKKLLALFLVVLISIESFGAVVSDNDGSAFVTKAEFETLKKSFSEQIDNYNTSIDSKIDGAIAAYLAGKKLSRVEVVKLEKTFNWQFPIICMNNSEWNDTTSKYYDYEIPNYDFTRVIMRSGDSVGATILDWNATTTITSYQAHNQLAVALERDWHVTKEKYVELVEISDTFRTRSLGGESFKAFECGDVGKGRHKAVYYTHAGGRDSGNLSTAERYFAYTGLLGIGVNSASAARAQMTKANFNKWTAGIWTRKEGPTYGSSLGWGTQAHTQPPLPADGLDLDGARKWAADYSNVYSDTVVNNASLDRIPDDNSRLSLSWKNDAMKHRSWIFTGDSDASATTSYGWSFDFVLPQTANDKLEGYIMRYHNDIGMATVENAAYYGFNATVPLWFYRYKASGSISGDPSKSQFSKLPAKQIYYYDSDKKIHYFDEGLFLFNTTSTPQSVTFQAKWEVLDPTVTTAQKLVLKISSKPFDIDHDSTTNLKYTVDGGAESADQQITCGSVKSIKVTCDESVKQLYMMWTPVTSSTYLGLTQLSDFRVEYEQ